ncbi:MAG: single-stranded DNA-binding protein [Methylicorpusculum sp.]|uniref:single-stranded DNA-binding protein n=1 Tax=Methylicorpusculum TaxID=2713642 RepID=UPI0013579BF5|nr:MULTISPECIES: single-stranded DNA-binding protein [Methylicorpusculum]MCD2452034.1 single-stranded DNA-binding protein [Methylicorpusculum oleiharenae]MDP2203502.1 single-stranded DNA-binding protein [Methylicorpusculum sp.]
MYNKSTIIGRLGTDPEVRFTQDQKAIANLRVATTETWKDRQSGERKEKTEWHRVVLFGKLAEIARDHLKKGALVLFEGPLRTRKWQDKDGKDQHTTELHAEEMKMLGSKSGSNSSSGSSASASQSADYPSNNYDDFDDIDF